MNFSARFVLDLTDHVWPEVYSLHKQRWLHVDACEETIDAPLMYEHGWKKKLSYVLAFSFEEVRDVTFRYSTQPLEVFSRRTLCDERWLENFLLSVTNQRFAKLANPRREALLAWHAVELEEFRVNKGGEAKQQDDGKQNSSESKQLKSEEQRGRQSGNVAWRQSRGELGDGSSSASTSSSSSVAATASSSSESKAPMPTANDRAVRDKLRVLFKQYVRQLTTGCGNASCENALCASSGNFKYIDAPHDKVSACKEALVLMQKHRHVNICVQDEDDDDGDVATKAPRSATGATTSMPIEEENDDDDSAAAAAAEIKEAETVAKSSSTTTTTNLMQQTAAKRSKKQEKKKQKQQPTKVLPIATASSADIQLDATFNDADIPTPLTHLPTTVGADKKNTTIDMKKLMQERSYAHREHKMAREREAMARERRVHRVIWLVLVALALIVTGACVYYFYFHQAQQSAPPSPPPAGDIEQGFARMAEHVEQEIYDAVSRGDVEPAQAREALEGLQAAKPALNQFADGIQGLMDGVQAAFEQQQHEGADGAAPVDVEVTIQDATAAADATHEDL
jgi:hypothetical protein